MNEQYKNDIVTLGCGSGGELYHQLIEEIFLPAFDNVYLREMSDSAICPINSENIAITTDSFVVNPRFFPGGDIGRLAVCGTVNDLAMSGATPLYLTVGMIIEAGFSKDELKQICISMAEAAKEANVLLVTGDTKVVEAGSCDGIFINTTGVGKLEGRECLGAASVNPDDVVIVSGNIGDHGIAVMSARHKLDFQPPIASDVAPLHRLAAAALSVDGAVKMMRDPTRGGIASTLNEWAKMIGHSIVIEEQALPMAANVRAACELLGIDPLYCANEGKMLLLVAQEKALDVLEAIRQEKHGQNACVIGKVQNTGREVGLATVLGSIRPVGMIDGEQLPRIC